jgi:hypothetical protein
LRPLLGERRTVAKVIERVEAHYEVQELKMGTVHRWCPESVVVECNCGEKPTLTASKTTCDECGVDHVAIVEEVLDTLPEDRVDHPRRFLNYYVPTRVCEHRYPMLVTDTETGCYARCLACLAQDQSALPTKPRDKHWWTWGTSGRWV